MTTESFRRTTPVTRPRGATPGERAETSRETLPPAPADGSDQATRARSRLKTLRTLRAQWSFFALLLVLASLVFWAFDALPFQDLPAHAGIIALRRRIATSAFDKHFFVFAPHLGPYSLFRFLGDQLFYPIVGPVGAVRALATLPTIALPAALVWGRRRLHGDSSPAAAFLALALSFGLMTAMGFASYLLGVAVMLFALVAWLELLVATDDRAPDVRRREIYVVLLAPLVFVAHGHAFVLFLLLAGVACLAAGNRRARLMKIRALVPAIAIAAWVAWLERATTVPLGSVPLPHGALEPRFQGPLDKLSLLFTPTLLTKSGIDLTLGLAVWALLGMLAFYTMRAPAKMPDGKMSDGKMSDGTSASPAETAEVRVQGPADASQRHARALFICAAAMALLFLALPHAVGWFGFVDGRLVPLLLVLTILGFRRSALPASLERLTDNAPPVLALGIVTVALVASARFQSEAAGYREVLGAVPEGAHLLNLPIDGNSAVFTGHPFIHYDKLVMTERDIVPSDIWFHQGTAVYPTADNPALRLPATYSESDLQVLDWPAYTLSDWDYVLLRTRPEADAPKVPSVLTLAEHRGGWWLYKHTP